MSEQISEFPNNEVTKSQGKNAKRVIFEWVRQIPRLRPAPPNETFQLVSREDLEATIKDMKFDSDSVAAIRLRADREHLEKELMPFFRDRDFAAHSQQNNYRLYQLAFIVLAALATFIGSLQVWALKDAPNLIIFIGLSETFVALITVFIAQLMGNDNPFALWLDNREQAEQLRREYFRYLTDAVPYAGLVSAKRRRRLSMRAAAINKGSDPDKVEE